MLHDAAHVNTREEQNNYRVISQNPGVDTATVMEDNYSVMHANTSESTSTIMTPSRNNNAPPTHSQPNNCYSNIVLYFLGMKDISIKLVCV